jgi:hypothetical protein
VTGVSAPGFRMLGMDEMLGIVLVLFSCGPTIHLILIIQSILTPTPRHLKWRADLPGFRD